MARLITAAQIEEWAGQIGAGPKYLLTHGCILTPGALDAARTLKVQVLFPGSITIGILQRLAEEVNGGPVRGEDLAALETQVLTRIQRPGS